MGIRAWTVFAALTASTGAFAQEHPACRDIDYAYQDHSSASLRAIAASCRYRDVAYLYYNRAYHADLLARADSLSSLIPYSGREREKQYDMVSYRYYMAMVESLSSLWFKDPVSRLRFLNLEYDRRSEIAELRLKGYDHIADRLERRAAAPE
jgi:hypothetical protein